MMTGMARDFDTASCPAHKATPTLGQITVAHGVLVNSGHAFAVCRGDGTDHNLDAKKVRHPPFLCKNSLPDYVVGGAKTVLIKNRYAARVGEPMMHGGVVGTGSQNVLIGGPSITPEDAYNMALAETKKVLDCCSKRIERWNDKDREMAKRWFGADDESTRSFLRDLVHKEQNLVANPPPWQLRYALLARDPTSLDNGKSATVDMRDPLRTVYLGARFFARGTNGRTGNPVADRDCDPPASVIGHEFAHIFGLNWKPHQVETYGAADCAKLAARSPARARNNADNFGQWMREVGENCP